MSKFSSRSGRTGSRGYRASVEEDKVVTSEAGSGTQPLFTEDMIGESTASVGLSVSMGFSTQFAREKFPEILDSPALSFRFLCAFNLTRPRLCTCTCTLGQKWSISGHSF